MTTNRNEAFAENMIGAVVKFEEQPYAWGTMRLTKIIERDVTAHRQFDAERGRQTITYSVFDIEGDVIEEHEIGALCGGVPVQSSRRNLAGRKFSMIGVKYGQLWRAINEDKPIIRASCG